MIILVSKLYVEIWIKVDFSKALKCKVITITYKNSSFKMQHYTFMHTIVAKVNIDTKHTSKKLPT
jgi:hypothetical protein